MVVSIRLYLDARAVKAGEPAPLRFVFTKRGVPAWLAVGIRVLPSQWDKARQRIVSHPQKDVLNSFLLSRMTTVQNLVLQLTASGELSGLTSLQIKDKIARLLDPEAGKDKLFLHRLEVFGSLKKARRTRELYAVTLRKVADFDKKAASLSFSDISKDWLIQFDAWLSANGCVSQNARNIHLRNIRAVFNDAIDNGITQAYPFRKFKIRAAATVKRAVSVETLRSIFTYPVEPWQQRYVDAFKLIFCLVGINVVDLLALTPEQLADGRLSYRRAKTGRLYDVKVEPEAAAIIEKYRGRHGRLLCWGENRKNYTSFTTVLDKRLKQIGQTVKEWQADESGVYREVEVLRPAFPMLSSYVARHSWATMAASLDVPKDVIAHALGHGGYSVTDIYIDFDQRKVDEANRRVLDWVFYGKK